MATFTKLKLSESTDGKPIGVVATSSPGTNIHTADATALDEVWIYAVNKSSSDRTISIEFGGTGASDLVNRRLLIDPGGIELIIPGIPLTNSLIVKAFVDSGANDVNILGFVNRIS